MVRQYLVIMLVCIGIDASSQQKTGNMTWDNINGIVSCITWTDSVVEKFRDYGSTENRPMISSGYTIHELDKRSNQISCAYYNRDSTLIKHIFNEYDAKNSRIKTAHRNSEDNLIGTYEYKYDETGYPIQRTIYDSTGSAMQTLDLKMKYLLNNYMQCFDSNGRVTKSIDYTDHSHDWEMDSTDKELMNAKRADITADTIMGFGSSGMKTMTVRFNENGKAKRTTYLYDTNGKEVERIEYNEYGEQENMLQMSYDDRGNMVERIALWEIDYIVKEYREEYRYDSNGKKAAFRSSLSDIVYEQDSGGHYKQVTTYLPDSDTLYDSKGRIKEYTYYGYGITYIRWVYAYDVYDNVVYSAMYDKNGSLLTEAFSRYEDIDTHGNWRKMTGWSWDWDNYGDMDNMPMVSYRNIKYYD